MPWSPTKHISQHTIHLLSQNTSNFSSNISVIANNNGYSHNSLTVLWEQELHEFKSADLGGNNVYVAKCLLNTSLLQGHSIVLQKVIIDASVLLLILG